MPAHTEGVYGRGRRRAPLAEAAGSAHLPVCRPGSLAANYPFAAAGSALNR